MSLFDTFTSKNPTYDDIRDIKSFTMKISFTKISSLKSEGIKNVIADLIVKGLVQHLEQENLFGFANISVKDDNEVQVVYADDIYHFGILVTEDSFSFARNGSTLESFFRTCEVFLPFFVSIYKDVVSYIQGAAQNIVFVPHFCGYKMTFSIEDFHPSTKTNKVTLPNYELMERLIPSIGRVESPITKMGFEHRGRTDVKVSGRINLNNIEWLAWLSVDAPGNQNYSTMDMVFELQSTTHEEVEGIRRPFNPQSIESWKTPLLPFLKDRVFCGFLEDWLSDINVKSVR